MSFLNVTKKRWEEFIHINYFIIKIRLIAIWVKWQTHKSDSEGNKKKFQFVSAIYCDHNHLKAFMMWSLFKAIIQLVCYPHMHCYYLDYTKGMAISFVLSVAHNVDFL